MDFVSSVRNLFSGCSRCAGAILALHGCKPSRTAEPAHRSQSSFANPPPWSWTANELQKAGLCSTTPGSLCYWFLVITVFRVLTHSFREHVGATGARRQFYQFQRQQKAQCKENDQNPFLTPRTSVRRLQNVSWCS